jgi:hypothetical protein
LKGAAADLGGGGGGETGFLEPSGAAGFASGPWAEPPAFGWPTRGAGALAPAFGRPAVPGRFGAAPADGGVPGSSFALGLGALGAGTIPPWGMGGAPFVPGTGSALAFGSAWPGGGALGDTFVGTGMGGPAFEPDGAPGVPGLVIKALGGIGSFPCWISEAFCWAASGSAGPTGTGVTPPCPAAPLAAGETGGAAALGWAPGPPGATGRTPGAAGSG